MSDALEVVKLKRLESFLVTMNIEKAFDTLDHNFQISTLQNYGIS